MDIIDSERIFLMLIDRKYKYIARNNDGYLVIFEEMPTKDIDIHTLIVDWKSENGDYKILDSVVKDCLTFIKETDLEPYYISDLIK